MRKSLGPRLPVILVALSAVPVFALACASAEPTAAPVAPAQPAAPVALTAAPVATSAPAIGAPTVVPLAPTATRVLPTPTPLASSKQLYGGTIKYAYSLDYDTMDPAYQSRTPSRRVLFTIFSNIVQMMPDGTIAPELARSWDFSADGKTVTFQLENGVKFHDGTTLDSQAVKWNFDRYMDAKTGSVRRTELTPPLERVEAVDSSTVRFHLTSPFRPLLVTLTTRAGQVASPTAVQKLNSYGDRNGEFGRKPVGSGMFKFKEWVPDSQVAVIRSDSYWDKGMPYADSIVFFQIPDARVIFAMLRTGELEVMEEVRTGDYELAKDNPNIKMVIQQGVLNRAVFFNTQASPWDKKALRQAFAYAMDRKAFVDVLYGKELAEESYHPLSRAHGVFYEPTVKMFEYSPEKAKQKLAEAGYPNGFSYEQPCRGSTFEIQWCEVAQVVMAKAGINMAIRPYDNAAYYTDWLNGKFKEPAWANLRARVDPHNLLQPFLHSKGAQTGLKWGNPAFDKLVDDAAGVYDVAKAKEMYRKALLILLDDSPMAFRITENLVFAVRSNVRDFVVHPDSEPRLRHLWLAK